MTLIRRISNVAFFIGVVILIVASLAPGQELPNTVLNDKWAHLVAYAMVMSSFGIGSSDWRRYVLATLAIFALGVALEGLQNFVPGRQPSALDVAANTIGEMVGVALAVLATRAIEVYISRAEPGPYTLAAPSNANSR